MAIVSEEEVVIQSEVEKQLQIGTIRRSTSAWVANCVVVRTKDGTARVLPGLSSA